MYVGIVVAVVVAVTGLAAPARADTSDFRIAAFQPDYYLDTDADGRSTLKTVEKITAEFPHIDQNHGIERALPTQYDGHSTHMRIMSVTDGSGAAETYSTYESGGNEVVRIGDKNRYAHELTTYVITYTQRDVTKRFGDRDELYWDVNGTEWHQPFDNVTARIKGTYGLRAKDAGRSAWFKKAALVLLVGGVITLSPLVLVAAIVAAVCAGQLCPLTDAGLALRRYLEGLKLYIGVAEEERLKLLQSPDGAEKAVASPDDPKQLVKLYERVLPYAILFGQEKQWNKQLGAYYERSGTNPDWYAGQSAFNAAVFTSAMNDFSSTTNSYAASTSSSSSGSGGGGFSGGGGGGGGGGGW